MNISTFAKAALLLLVSAKSSLGETTKNLRARELKGKGAKGGGLGPGSTEDEVYEAILAQFGDTNFDGVNGIVSEGDKSGPCSTFLYVIENYPTALVSDATTCGACKDNKAESNTDLNCEREWCDSTEVCIYTAGGTLCDASIQGRDWICSPEAIEAAVATVP